jgi:uncharacterized membrane protein
MIGASLPLFLVSIVMFYVWRLWLRLHGEKWKPTGRQRHGSYTEASDRYLDSILSPRQKFFRTLIGYAGLAVTAGVVAFAIFHGAMSR